MSKPIIHFWTEDGPWCGAKDAVSAFTSEDLMDGHSCFACIEAIQKAHEASAHPRETAVRDSGESLHISEQASDTTDQSVHGSGTDDA